jgi:hypothetical protein
MMQRTIGAVCARERIDGEGKGSFQSAKEKDKFCKHF